MTTYWSRTLLHISSNTFFLSQYKCLECSQMPIRYSIASRCRILSSPSVSIIKYIKINCWRSIRMGKKCQFLNFKEKSNHISIKFKKFNVWLFLTTSVFNLQIKNKSIKIKLFLISHNALKTYSCQVTINKQMKLMKGVIDPVHVVDINKKYQKKCTNVSSNFFSSVIHV